MYILFEENFFNFFAGRFLFGSTVEPWELCLQPAFSDITFLVQTNVLSAKYVMKTDDDAFVRVDEILSSLHQVNISHGLLYGRVNSDSQPHRDPYSKWYITSEVTF